MDLEFTRDDSLELYRLLAETSTDVILKTDRKGFILHASPAMERLNLLPPGALIGPHLLDLVDPASAASVEAAHEAALCGDIGGGWTEFAARTQDGSQRWFEINVRGLSDGSGAVSVMRSVQERRSYEEKLFAAALTDPLTGLTNRPAFISMLQHLVDRRVGGCIALFDVDHLRSINMQYGQSVGDEVLVVFADFLRNLMRSQDIISRIGGECLAVLLPDASPDQAETLSRRIIATLSEIRQTTGPGNLCITVSAGVARIGGSLDDTIRRAELALFFAKAKGRNRLEMDQEAAPSPALPQTRSS